MFFKTQFIITEIYNLISSCLNQKHDHAKKYKNNSALNFDYQIYIWNFDCQMYNLTFKCFKSVSFKYTEAQQQFGILFDCQIYN